MNIAVNRLFQWIAIAALGVSAMAQPALAQEVPANEFVEKFSNEVLAEIKSRKQELVSDPRKLDALIDQKVMPNVNFRKMTQLVVGRPWREATPEQREQITKEFRTLLVKTYSGALSQVGDQTIRLGNRSDWAAMLDKLKMVYRRISNENGWTKYATIDLQFKDQIVCGKGNGLYQVPDSTAQMDSLKAVAIADSTVNIKNNRQRGASA